LVDRRSLRGASDAEAAFRRLYDHFAQPSAWSVHPEAGVVLAALSERGLVLGMASNFDTRLRQVLRGHPALAPIWKRVVISSEVGARKPAAAFFHAVISAAECPAERILFVGDDVMNDHDGAASAGLVPLLLDPDSRHSASRRIRRLADLLD
jgi:putative hydrolase of the HAD superfamily